MHTFQAEIVPGNLQVVDRITHPIIIKFDSILSSVIVNTLGKERLGQLIAKQRSE